MNITIQGKAGSKLRVTDDTATGIVEITVEDPDGVSVMQIGNGEVFELALKLLSVVEHTR